MDGIMKTIPVVGDLTSFSNLCAWQKTHDLPLELFFIADLEHVVENHSLMIVFSPQILFAEGTQQLLRDFVLKGGHLLFLSSRGGDAYNNSNHSTIFSGIADNSDMLLGIEKTGLHQPHIDMRWHHPKSSFQGTIVYDGGCSYQVLEGNSSTLFVEATNVSTIIGLQKNPIGTDLKYHWQKKGYAGAILVHQEMGQGSVTFWGSRWMFSDNLLDKKDNLRCWQALLQLQKEYWQRQLHLRMNKEQRHRLLHAFPMSSGLVPYTQHPRQLMNTIRRKRNAIGIIPHTFCNTGKRGCGFCTFPHETYSKIGIEQSMRAVISEIQLRTEHARSFSTVPLSSVYIGGGTANLSHSSLWKEMLSAVRNLPHSPQTEFTLEGAPLYFWSNRDLLESLVEIFPEAKKRMSIGVQSFDDKFLTMMGRNLMNKKLVEGMKVAEELGICVSIDLLCNLPAQSTEEILRDIHKAVDMGIPHICVYNLVCYEGLGTEWANDPVMRASLPTRERSIYNMERVFETLDSLGYDAITLTDFQKRGSGETGRYRYEEDIRQPENVHWWGIGPGGISVLWDRVYGIKLVNPQISHDYVEQMNRSQGDLFRSWDRSFWYTEPARRLYWLTRQIKGLSIDAQLYHKIFRRDIHADFGEMWTLLQRQGLLSDILMPTSKGRYYADSMAGLLVEYVDAQENPMVPFGTAQHNYRPSYYRRGNDARRTHMG